MKNKVNVKSLFRTSLVALCLLTIGVGNTWAGTKRIYAEYSAVSSWWGNDGRNALPYIYAWGGGHDAKKYTMKATGISNLAYCDIDDYHTDFLFFRSKSQTGSWDNQTVDISIGSNNRWSILDSQDGSGHKYTGSAQRWTPTAAIDGLLDPKNPHNQMFTDGTYSTTLEAHKTYEFKILETSTLYGLNDLIATSSISNQTLNTSGYQVRLCTAGAGTYTFAYNSSTHQLSITYPETSHPSIDYCYVIDYSWSPSANLHLWDGTSTKVAEWNGGSTIAGSAWPGAAISNKTTINGQSYFYIAPGEYANFLVSKNGDGTDRSGDLTTSDGYGKRRYYNGSSWVWDTFTVRIQLNDLSATTAVDPTYQDVAFNSDVLTDLTSVPAKTHYDFGGFYTGYDEVNDVATGTQVINSNGEWIASVAGYTDADKHWIHDGTSTTLYAKWTEHEYAITMEVSPAGTGTTSPASTATGKLVTESGNITATPAAGYKFKEWQFSKTGEAYDVWCADGYSSTDATIHIKAQHNGTLTAVFEERYSLVGSLYDGSEGGMPGWEDYSKTFTVNSSSPVDLTRTCTLQAGKTYKVQVHDLATSTNLGRSGCDPVCVLEENASLVMENSNNDVFLYTSGAGEYIFKITAVDGSGHPTLTVLRPYPVNFGQKYQDIDGTLHAGTTGGTAAATAGGDALTSGDYVTYNTSVTHTATAESGYTFAGWWSSDAFEGARFSGNNPMTYAVTSGDNAYAKFVETSTSVTLSNDGHGKVQIGGVDKTSTTCGVTTTRSLTAVPNAGYKFSSWSKSGSDISFTSTSTNPTTLRGQGGGATSGQTVTANFTYRYSIKGTMNGENWGITHTLCNIGTNAGSKDTCYVTMTLPANTTYEFAIYDEQTGGWYKAGTDAVYDMTYTNHTNWEFGDTRTYNCGITTAGKGTYKFIFNITDKTVTVVYPTSYQVNFGASVGGSVTSVVDGDGNAVPNGGYVVAGGSVTYTAAANDGYTFVGWCGNDSYGNTFTTYNPWTNSSIAATSNAYAKFKSTDFIIYRSGDMSSDPRAAYDDVESYAGGTISEAIEYRMKVHTLDQWYSLCLPFIVSAVKVWDEVDGEYYDLVPYYRTKVGAELQGGHYIIRTPSAATDLALADFGDWRDPTSPTGYVPAKNTPYIIQWHMPYFQDKYISFFGATGQTIPTSMTAGSAPSSDNVVNVCGNNSMKSGTVRDAYLLESDYGPGAWLREEIGTDRTIPPFECYLLASSTTAPRYAVIRPGMNGSDTPTGWDDVVNSELQTTISVYTVSGILVARFSNCSITEAAQQLSNDRNEGLFILRSNYETVKLMLGGK